MPKQKRKTGPVPHPKNPADGYVKQTWAIQVIGCSHATLQLAFAAGLPRREDGLVHLETAKAWFADRHKRKELSVQLSNEKKQEEIAELKIIKAKRQFELATMRGENHNTMNCASSLGILLTSVWQEIQSMPSRLAAVF